MNTTYNPQEPSAVLINEIKYYMAFSALKKLFLKGSCKKESETGEKWKNGKFEIQMEGLFRSRRSFQTDGLQGRKRDALFAVYEEKGCEKMGRVL